MSLYGHNIVTYGGVNCHNIVASSRILQDPPGYSWSNCGLAQPTPEPCPGEPQELSLYVIILGLYYVICDIIQSLYGHYIMT